MLFDDGTFAVRRAVRSGRFGPFGYLPTEDYLQGPGRVKENNEQQGRGQARSLDLNSGRSMARMVMEIVSGTWGRGHSAGASRAWRHFRGLESILSAVEPAGPGRITITVEF